jgi:cysteine-rich repeat protein
MRRALAVLALATLPGCGLALDFDPPDPDDGLDAGMSRADAGQPDDDAGVDGGPITNGDAGPSECGNRVLEFGEECDDGNRIAGDGCEDGCTFTCETNVECDDRDECTFDHCLHDVHLCAHDTCRVPDDCTMITGCAGPTIGCVFAPRDADGDGEGPAEPGCGPDCNDFDPLVSTAQTGFFDLPHGASGSFDWNCDGIEELERPDSMRIGTCGDLAVGATCDGRFGWTTRTPLCGEVGDWTVCASSGGVCAPDVTVPLVQRCR